MLLDDLHEASKIQLRIQSQIVNIGNQRGDFLFELPKLLFKRIDIVLLIFWVVVQFVVRPSVVGSVRLDRSSTVFNIVVLRLFLLLFFLFVN